MGEWEGRFDEQIVEAQREVIEEISSILVSGAGLSARPSSGEIIATLKFARRNPSAAQNYELPGFVQRHLAAHYQREREDKATYYPDIIDVLPIGFDGNKIVPATESIVNAASAAIVVLEDKQTRGRPSSRATHELAPRLREVFLRYNEKVSRHSEWTSLGNGKLFQTESGPFFEFLAAVIAPLNSFLREHDLRKIAPSTLARTATQFSP